MLPFNPNKLIIGLICVVIAFAFWYHYIDTLMFSEIVGNEGGYETTIFVNLIDFNTQLSRHDIRRLKSKVRKWVKRLEDIEKIRDTETRRREYKKTMVEITADPSMKKIIRKVSIFGKDAVLPILQVINAL